MFNQLTRGAILGYNSYQPQLSEKGNYERFTFGKFDLMTEVIS